MDFDVSDVDEPVWRRSRHPTEPIPIDEDDMLEPACLVPPRRFATGTTPPPSPPHVAASDAVPLLIDAEITPRIAQTDVSRRRPSS